MLSLFWQIFYQKILIALHADIVLSYEKHLSCGMSSLNIMVSFYYWERSLGITQSFSRSGSPYDNAVIESFFNLLKKEELHRRVYRSEQEFLRCVDEYISFYNSSRPHRYNNYKSPDSTEKLFEKSMLSADLPWRLQVQISCPFIDSYLFLRFNTKFVQLGEFVKSARKRCFYNKKLV